MYSLLLFSELYIDGNDLQCEGVIDLVTTCAEHAQNEAYEREQERLELIQQEEEELGN